MVLGPALHCPLVAPAHWDHWGQPARPWSPVAGARAGLVLVGLVVGCCGSMLVSQGPPAHPGSPAEGPTIGACSPDKKTKRQKGQNKTNDTKKRPKRQNRQKK